MNKIGKNVRLLRQLRNISQQQVAEKLGMTQGNFARMEKGEILFLDERLKQVAHVLGYSPEFIRHFHPVKICLMAEKEDELRKLIQIEVRTEMEKFFEDKIQKQEKKINELHWTIARLETINKFQ